MPGPAAPNDVRSILAAAKRKPAPVYLLVGEPFESEIAARGLIDLLVPPERRSLNLEVYDGRSAALAPILDSLRTPGLFPGTKLVWVREPALFLSGEKRTDVTAAMCAAWGEGSHSEAAEKLLTLVAMAGWTQERFLGAEWAGLKKTEATALFGGAIDARQVEILSAVRDYCAGRQLAVAAYRDESALLDEFLQAGMPPSTVLLFTAATVDRRKRVVKTIQAVGTMAEFTLRRERSGALSAESVEHLIGQAVVRHGKRLAPPARRLILQRAGTDPRELAMELEKLCLYVGDSPSIGEEDVRASLRDLAESWVFDFTAALAKRQAAAAVALLRALFEQGEHPLRLLALIARELRLLLLARDCLTHSLAGSWSPGVTFPVFRDRLLPMLGERDRDALVGIHPYALYLALQNAGRVSTTTLQRGVLALHKLDITFKSTPVDPRLRLEAFVLDMCKGEAEPAKAGA